MSAMNPRFALLTVSALFGPLVIGDSANALGQIVVKVATVAHEGSPLGAQLLAFKRHIVRESNGLVRVKIFTGGSLGNEQILSRRTREGSLQVFAGTAEGLSEIVPELNVLNAPYLFASAPHAARALDGPVRRRLRPIMASRGLVFGAWTAFGFRSWYTKNRPIRSPQDLQGLRLRVGDNPAQQAFFQHLGATPVPVAAKNMLNSLRQNEIDGFAETTTAALASSWYRGVRYLTLSRHSYRFGMLAYSKRWFEGLPEQLQHTLTKIPRELGNQARSTVSAMMDLHLQSLRRRGIEIHEPTNRERRAFVRATRKLPRTLANQAGRGGWSLLNAVRSIR